MTGAYRRMPVIAIGLLVTGVLTMSFWDRLFGSNRKDDPPSPLGPKTSYPWDEHPSIYEHVRAHIKPGVDGLVEEGMSLPDEAKINDSSEVSWMSGALDGVLGHHSGGNEDDEPATLLTLLKTYASAPSSQNKLKAYQFIVEHRALSLIDPLMELLRTERGMNLPRLYELAHSFATEAPDREPVKLGIALLGMFKGLPTRELFLELGRHEEFTLFSAVALTNTQENPEDDLWQLAKHVNGWGRIHVVERLAETEDPRIRRWLLRHGYKNSIMHEYLAYTCAVAGNLRTEIERPEVDDELFDATGEIITALICGGPAQDMDDYQDGSAVVEAYLHHLESHASTLAHLLVAQSISDWLSSTEADWQARAAAGWTPDRRQSFLERCRKIKERDLWHEQALAGLASADEPEFHRAGMAANILGIEAWPYHWNRLRSSPLEQGRWYFVMEKCDANRIDAVIALAEAALPLSKIAIGPALEMGFGREYCAHGCLDFILQDLGRFPGHGVKLIETALRSPVVRNRNMALRALAEWGRQNWPPGIPELLQTAMEQEPHDHVRQQIQKALNGLPPDR